MSEYLSKDFLKEFKMIFINTKMTLKVRFLEPMGLNEMSSFGKQKWKKTIKYWRHLGH